MNTQLPKFTPILFGFALALSACGSDGSDDAADITTTAPPTTLETSTAPAPSVAPSFPLVGGFEGDDDECQIAGESEATGNFLDHTALLVACPIGSFRIAEIETDWAGRFAVAAENLEGYKLLSVSTE